MKLTDMDIVLSACLVQPSIYGILQRHLIPECFTSDSHRYIYELLNKHSERYKSHPQLKDLIASVDNSEATRRGLNPDSVKDIIADLMTQNQSIDDVVKDKAKSLILEHRMRVYLENLIESMKKGADKIYTESMKEQLIDLLNIDFASEDAQIISFESYWNSKIANVGENGEASLRSFMSTINMVHTANGYVGGTLNMLVAPPSTGKSTWLINEGKYSAMNGNDVLHVIIGDMTDYSIMNKYIASISEVDLRTLVTMTKSKIRELIGVINSTYDNVLNRIHVLTYSSYALRAEDLVSAILRSRTKTGIDYKMVIIDYPDNLIHGEGSMYTDVGEIYGHLERLAKTTKSVVWVASQPKQGFWDSEIIPLSGASESSRKQHIVDDMITMNLHARDANFGTMFLAKIREGSTGGIIRFRTDYSRSIITEITEEEYLLKLKEYNASHQVYNNSKKEG